MADDNERRRNDACLEAHLEATLAGPPAPPEFRQRLRERLLSAHPCARAAEPAVEQSANRRTKIMAQRRWFTVPQRAALLVAALALVVVTARFVLLREPAAEFGQLPGPGAGLAPALSGAGGPGVEFDLTYRLGGTLVAGWPSAPNSQLAYRVRPAAFSADRVRAIATRLGITAPVVQEGWAEGYLWAADPGDGGPSLRMYPNGYTVYTQPYDYRPLARNQLPSDEQAVAAARQWLVASGIAAANLGNGVITEDLDIGVLHIRFRPAEPLDVVTPAPWAQVQMGADRHIVNGAAVWFDLDTNSRYPLRTFADAWAGVQAGQGTLSWAVAEWPGPVGEDNTVRGTMTAQSARLAWGLGRAADGAYYLVPMYVFAGEVEAAGEDGVVRVSSTVWIAAVTQQYRGR
jgi:hypothetical protein